MKRSRGRGRRQQNPVNRSYDSNGPDVRVRGTASQVLEKYQALARDAMSAGDRVMAENYQQHAEHYYRILQSFQPQPGDNENADAANGASEETAQSAESNGAANGDAGEENGKSGEPLVLMRENDEAESGKEASKSRRRGPLGKKRKAKSEDADDEGDAEATPTNIDADTGSDGEAVHSGE
jgi:hypothetical protein